MYFIRIIPHFNEKYAYELMKRKTVIWIYQSSGSNCCLEKAN